MRTDTPINITSNSVYCLRCESKKKNHGAYCTYCVKRFPNEVNRDRRMRYFYKYLKEVRDAQKQYA